MPRADGHKGPVMVSGDQTRCLHCRKVWDTNDYDAPVCTEDAGREDASSNHSGSEEPKAPRRHSLYEAIFGSSSGTRKR